MLWKDEIVPVARETSNEAVYRAILDLIVDGRAASGARLVERELARALGVSRTPVREALIRLKTDGFVRDAGNRGLAVAELDVSEAAALYRLVGAMEAHLVEAVPTYPDETARRLEEIEAQARDVVGDRGRTIELGTLWHRTLVQPSACVTGRRHLAELYAHIERCEHYFFAASARASSPVPPSRAEGKAEHRDISLYF